jgi:hypothetical protein
MDISPPQRDHLPPWLRPGDPQSVHPVLVAVLGHGFLDYLYVSVTNVMAFSPTDTMPMARWAKMMTVQAMVALSTAGLVIARAVNVLG